MDLTPTIEQLKEQVYKLTKIINELEYQQLLNRAVENAHKLKSNETDNSSSKRNTLGQ